MRESCTYGSVRGARGNSRPYRVASIAAPARGGLWPRPCENSNARRARRNILEKLRVMRTDNAAGIQLDAVLENCIFYIFPMYEFLHSLGQNR